MITFKTINGVTLVLNNGECVNVITTQGGACRIGSGRRTRLVQGSLAEVKARLVSAAR